MEIFQRFIDWLLPVKDIKSALNVKLAISDEMLQAIEIWHLAYGGKAPWLSEEVTSMRLEKAICREFANVSLNEMTVSCNNKILDEQVKRLKSKLLKQLRKGLASGAMVIKPIGTKGLQFLDQSEFLPIEYDEDGRLKNVIFPEIKKVGDYYYTRLEHHVLDDETGLTISNTAYRSSTKNNLGQQFPLSILSEWENIPESINYPDMHQQAFGYYANPVDNCIDNSEAGVSIYDDAFDTITFADNQFSRINWEFESGERAVHVDSAALNISEKRFRMDRTFNRLYRGLDVAAGSSGELFDDYTPTIRQKELSDGLNEYLRLIEFSVGLAFGDLSNPQSIDKTATEVMSAKQRKYDTVTAIQECLKPCIEETVYAIAFYNRLATSGYELTIDFNDSILTDEKAEREQDERDLANGTLRPEEYRSKWRGETVEVAMRNLPQNSDVIE